MAALEFQINLAGNLTSALGGAARALGETEKGARGAAHEVGLFEAEIGHLSEGVGGLSFNLQALAKGGAGLFTFDLAEGVELFAEALKGVYELAEKVVDAVVDIGKEFIKTAGESSDLNLSVDLVFGDQAEAIRGIGQQFQARSRFQQEEIEKMLLPLGQAGIRDSELIGRIATAATDIAARGGGGIGAAQEAVEAFKKIQLRGEVNPKILERVFGSEQAFYADLGQQLGVSTKTAEAMAKSHKISNDRLLNTVLHQVSVQEGTPGVLGPATERSARTLGGTLQRLGNLPGNFMRAIAKSAEEGPLAGVLDRLLVQLDPSGPAGQNIVAGFEMITTRIMGAFENLDVTSLVDNLVDGVTAIGGAFKIAWPFIETFGRMLVAAADGAKRLWETLGPIYKTVGGLMLGGGPSSTTDRISGILSTYAENRQSQSDTSGLQRIYKNNALRDLSAIANDTGVNQSGRQAAMQAAQSVLDAAPKMADGGVVTRPTFLQAGEAGPEAIVPLDQLGGGGRSGMTITVGDIHVHVAGSDGRTVGFEAAKEIRSELKKIIDEAGYGIGADLTG